MCIEQRGKDQTVCAQNEKQRENVNSPISEIYVLHIYAAMCSKYTDRILHFCVILYLMENTNLREAKRGALAQQKRAQKCALGLDTITEPSC